MITKQQYLANPCRAASIPYWKISTVSVPDNMRIVHQEDYCSEAYKDFSDEPYFRLQHDLQHLITPLLPWGYRLCEASLGDFATHINSCYQNIGITEDALQGYMTHPVYDQDLWLAVQDVQTGQIVATGIGELDATLGEGILEWIQVSNSHRRRGLGKYLVLELLRRMGNKARFSTVSGQCNNVDDPEALYRACGFTGQDVWHILTMPQTT